MEDIGAEHVTSSPPDQFVQNLDILLHVCHLHRLLRVEDREWRAGRAVVDVLAAGLEKAADEEDLEEGVCILEELELPTGRD